MSIRSVALFACAFALLVGSLGAQSTRGVILGVVTDPSGSAVPSAEVTVTNQGTGFSAQTTSATDGQYTITNLEPGPYRVSVAAKGFKTRTVRDVIVYVNQTLRVDVKLEIGDVATTVEVEAEAPVVQSETSLIGSVVDSRQVQTMPLNGRSDIFRLLQLAPGVIRSGQNPVIAGGEWFGSTNMTIDGSSNIDTGNERLLPLTPSLESIAEFKVISENASAEFGRGGGQVVVATKAGTNEYHGSLFAFNRNRVLSAKNFSPPACPSPPLTGMNSGGRSAGRSSRTSSSSSAASKGCGGASPPPSFPPCPPPP